MVPFRILIIEKSVTHGGIHCKGMGLPISIVEAGGYVVTLGSAIPWTSFINASWVPGE